MAANLKSYIALAHAVKAATGCTDPCDLREAVNILGDDLMSTGEDDATLTLDGEDWRFIRRSAIDAIMQEELEGDEYVLGCASAWFLADVLGVDTDAIEQIQKADAYAALGKMVIGAGKLEEYQREMVRHDGYGGHFSSYDGNEVDIDGTDYIAFRN